MQDKKVNSLSTKPLRVAVAGLGIGRRHLQAFRLLPAVEVVAVASRSESTVQQAQQEFQIPHGFTDVAQMLDAVELDALSICTPDRQHAEQTLLALEAGLHVLCEKPLTTTLEEAATLVQRVRKSDRTVMVGQNFRFLPQFSQLQQRVKAGAIGELFLAESNYIQNLYAIANRGPEHWRLRDPQDFYLGGAVHNVDLLRWVAGEIVEVHSYAKHIMPFYGLDDNYVSNLRFASGAIGRLALVLGARLKDKFQLDLRVYGPAGALSSSLAHSAVVEDADHLSGDKAVVSPVEPADAIALEVAHFVHCIRSGQPPLCDIVEGAKNVAVCLAAIQSAQSGQPVTVDYSFLN